MKVAELFEGKRQKGVDYKEVKNASDVVERVIAGLKGKESASWTRLTKEYVDIDDKLKKLTVDRNKLNDDIKSAAAELFDVADDVLTRVIETAQLTLTLSKKTKKDATTEVDYEKVVKSLLESKLVPGVKKMLDELIKANSKAIAASEVPEKLTVKRNKVDEGFSLNGIKAWFSGLAKKLKGMIASFDEDLHAAKAKLAAA